MKFRNIALAGLLAVSAIGCKETKTELSDLMHEDAQVSYMHHTSAWSQPILIGKIVSIIYHPEQNNISFSGPIGFELNDKRIYSRFSEVGEKADISYREVYKLTFDDLKHNGQKELTGKELVRYEFVDAERK